MEGLDCLNTESMVVWRPVKLGTFLGTISEDNSPFRGKEKGVSDIPMEVGYAELSQMAKSCTHVL